MRSRRREMEARRHASQCVSCEPRTVPDLHIGRLIEVFIELPKAGKSRRHACTRSSAMLTSHSAVGRSNRHRYDDARRLQSVVHDDYRAPLSFTTGRFND